LSILQGKSGTKIRATFVFFQKLPKVNNRPLGENSPNLVTLLVTLLPSWKERKAS
jgi:hypothetical protein